MHGTEDSLAAEAPGEEVPPLGVICSKQDDSLSRQDSTGAPGPAALTDCVTRESHSTVLSLSFLLCKTGATAAPTHGCFAFREVMS